MKQYEVSFLDSSSWERVDTVLSIKDFVREYKNLTGHTLSELLFVREAFTGEPVGVF